MYFSHGARRSSSSPDLMEWIRSRPNCQSIFLFCDLITIKPRFDPQSLACCYGNRSRSFGHHCVSSCYGSQASGFRKSESVFSSLCCFLSSSVLFSRQNAASLRIVVIATRGPMTGFCKVPGEPQRIRLPPPAIERPSRRSG